MRYGKIGLTTMAVAQYLLSEIPLVLYIKKKLKNSSAFATVYYLIQDNAVPNCPNSYATLNTIRHVLQ